MVMLSLPGEKSDRHILGLRVGCDVSQNAGSQVAVKAGGVKQNWSRKTGQRREQSAALRVRTNLTGSEANDDKAEWLDRSSSPSWPMDIPRLL